MWDLLVSIPDHCLSFYFDTWICFSILNSLLRQLPLGQAFSEKVSKFIYFNRSMLHCKKPNCLQLKWPRVITYLFV